MVTETPKLVLMVIAVVGLAQAGFLISLLRQEGKRAFRANRWLMVFALTACLSFIEDITDVFLTPRWMLLVAPVFMSMTFAFVPSIYLYFREIADQPVRRPIYHFLVLIPVLVATSVAVWILFDQFVPEIIHGTDVEIDLALDENLLLSVLLMSTFIGLYVQLFAYMPKIWKVALGYLRQAGEQLGADQVALRRWIQEILIGITAIFVIFTVTSVIDIFVDDGTWLTTIVQGSFALVFFRMCHLMASSPALFVQAEWQDTVRDEQNDLLSDRSGSGGVTSDDGNSTKSLLDDDDVRRICERLKRVATETDMLFDPLLSMPKLANAIAATPNQLSFVLNQHLGKSFFDFINEARTNEASKLLIDAPDRTILDIATSVGFNSKSTFNLAFKKITGKTPSAYRTENLDKSDI
ncbi:MULTISPECIES: AraC family transcriptional regulator [Thalassospira]|uniref:AraC family transcriptional regulator n=2 Tax=Thalassospira TaxID=168934 RepID=A0A367WAK0_9PROT|nr:MULTISPECIES: helix-turn-helix domain-containing protein [Thalassospira]MDG4720011.1 helix-turn-helix domain-containing protein [Thalassospira sp. FZY0004]RCK38448.1 AraC family transcriptional regulator [Thalassospira profundimaris]